MEIKIRKLKRGDELFILEIDYGEFHHNEVSKDEKYIDSVYEAIKVIKLGIEKQFPLTEAYDSVEVVE